ncbi:MAG: NAD-glutamate dehydrogenase [Actinobacteria bacterium]|nr:NAD-glutamate dehydrogenase [Actinomycetota bacterium]
MTSTMPSSVPAELAGITDPQERVLSARYYRYLAEEDHSSHPVTAVREAARALLDLGRDRVPGTSLVRASSPEDAGEAHSVLEVITDDMSFLVDSVTNALTADGRAVHLVVHPQLVVRRDGAGRLLEILDLDVDKSRPADTIAESWMWIELERDFTDDGLVGVEERVSRVLGDVRLAVRDWRAMRSRAVILAEEIVAAPPVGLPKEMVDEGVDLLRWLADDNLTFLGYREYALETLGDEDVLIPVSGTGLGILSAENMPDFADTASRSFAALSPSVRALAREPKLLVLSKANSRSTVHRSVYLDYIGVKRFDANGLVIGERRFLGLYSSSAYTQSILDIPILRNKYEHLLAHLDYVPGAHNAKDLLQFLETYPRDELFQTHDSMLSAIAGSVLHLQERRHTKLYLRPDDYGRFMSCLVYLPRDRYTTAVRLRIERLLMEAFGGVAVDYTARVSERVLARLHYVIRVPEGAGLPHVDEQSLEAQVAAATRSWQDEFTSALVARVGDVAAAPLLRSHATAFPEAYKEDFGPARAVNDALVIDALAPGELSLEIYEPANGSRRELRLKVTRVGPAMSLSRVLPILQSMGVDVVDEYPYEISRALKEPAWILDFGMLLPDIEIPDRSTLSERFEEAFGAAWNGRCGVDGFNALVVKCGLRWRQALILRAYARYMRQIGSTFSQSYLESVIIGNVGITRLLIRLFEIRFAPGEVDARMEAEAAVTAEIEAALNDVASLDQDRILRTFLALVRSTLRTNFFQVDDDGIDRSSVAFKLDPSGIPDLPLPKPQFEIWVYAPRVEGVHLRFGPVARGGLRWSDRQEDFRTEILGLVKAQEVKNAVIVPVGAKGGFYAKQLPDPSVDREAWLAEGKAAYREFIISMLDITDNLVDGIVVPPPNVVRHDGDDTYLVVAADKGTATFSDLANSVAAEYDFWLGDAFASGGSVGYDHKAMGITARGAWESVERHFRELGVNTQEEPFTVAGVGDMSGDVFGNGMLLSNQIRLVVAFDHRHVFIDPSPDAASSFDERRRLFDLPRSSWADYDRSLLSQGGGVFSRAAKSIDVTPEMAEALGIPMSVTVLTPDELIRSALMAPVDLLWNGGIGTYVKAETETNVDVGDKANDRIRIDGNDLRCKVVGEGGNLGMTQLGRVEAARHGVRLNTDAIDNSAGVDTSDHEVNIKILLDGLVRGDELPQDDRNVLLASMTDVIAEQVLEDNYGQNVVLGNARAGATSLITVHQRMIRELERLGILDRAIEFLPDDAELRTRRLAGEGLTSPELAVLLAYSKIWLTKELNASGIADESFFANAVVSYFPPELADRFGDALHTHPLRSEIITTVTCNSLLNIAGITFVFRAMEETGASPVEVVRAASAAIEIFDIAGIWQRINEQDDVIPTTAQCALHLENRRLLDRATRWFLQTRGGSLDVQGEIDRFAAVVSDRAQAVPTHLLGKERERYERLTQRFVAAGAPDDLARSTAAALDVFALLDVVDVCGRADESVDTVVPLYFAISERYDVDRTLVRITDLPRGDRWSSLARQALRSDLYAVVAGLTARLLASTSAELPAHERLLDWERAHAEGVARARSTLEDISSVENPDLATLSVALRAMRNLVAQGLTTSGTD